MRRNAALWMGLGVLAASVTAWTAAGCSRDGGKKQRFVTIGTGGVTGVYYPAGGVIAKFVNRKTDAYGIRMSVQSTGGSVFNINAVLAGDLEFGIAQSDKQYQAMKGQAEWADRGPQTDLRAVCSLHPELITLVAADDAGIRTLADLKGKTVNLGNPGSGQRGNAMDVLKAAGVKLDDIRAEGLKASECPDELQNGRLDAFFYTVGHPNGAITQATAGLRRKVRFVPITGMDELIAASPYYAVASVPVALYPKAVNTEDVPTVGVMTTVVTSARVSDDVVYAVTREIFENLDELKSQHPAFARLTAESMRKGLSAPIHPGAMKYFKEAGLEN
ncbi:MAG TPA: TAXI family TRAP transporter solute-binding subunit [Phycisphaerae bacterium]|nr:TAXI family TRAP transporter solute-binding subunit [Phycisphaerae bacterium]